MSSFARRFPTPAGRSRRGSNAAERRLGDRPRLGLDSLLCAGRDVPLEDEEHRKAGEEQHAAV
jgi:hypothetical protein